MLALLLPLANWIPDPSPEWGTSPTPYVTLFVVGFLIGVAGHIVRSRPIVALGVLLVFLGTFILPLGVYLSKSP